MPKKTVKKKPKFSAKTKFIILFIAVLLTPFIGQAYGQWKLERNFKEIENSVESLEAALVGNVVEDMELEKYCYKESVKFSGGSLKCVVKLKSEDLISMEQLEKTILYAEATGFKSKSRIDPNEPKLFIDYEKPNAPIYCQQINLKNLIKGKVSYAYEFICLNNSKRSFYPYRSD